MLGVAESRAADRDLFETQLGRLGGTIYELANLEATIEGRPMVPMSLLNRLRRELVARLDDFTREPSPPPINPQPVLPRLLEPILAERDRERRLLHQQPAPVELSVLCRRTDQIEAALELGVSTIYAEYQDIKQYAQAVATVRRSGCGATIFLATPRIEKPGEANLFGFLARQGADGILVRNAGGMQYCAERGIPFVADFSLNAANPLTVDLLKSRGAARVTASYDLNVDQLLQLIDMTPASWLEVVIHQQIPMFHMEHCVYCAFLSPGTDATNCGRPCDHHDVKLRDRVGKEHPLKADVGCRNTLYNAVPQTAAEYLPRLLKHGANCLRIEFLDDSPAAVDTYVTLYREVIAGRARGQVALARAQGKQPVRRHARAAGGDRIVVAGTLGIALQELSMSSPSDTASTIKTLVPMGEDLVVLIARTLLDAIHIDRGTPLRISSDDSGLNIEPLPLEPGGRFLEAGRHGHASAAAWVRPRDLTQIPAAPIDRANTRKVDGSGTDSTATSAMSASAAVVGCS